MALLIEVDCDFAKRYNVRTISTKYENKKHRVFMRLTCDDFDLAEAISIAKSNTNVLMVEYKGTITNEAYTSLGANTGVYVGRMHSLGNNICEQDIAEIFTDTPLGVTPIISLPDDFKDLELLYRLSEKFPRLRFCGGQLFAIDGVKCGAIGVDILESKGVKFAPEAYRLSCATDAIKLVDVLSIELEVSDKPEKPAKVKSSSSGKSSSDAPKKPKTMMFSNIIGKREAILP